MPQIGDIKTAKKLGKKTFTGSLIWIACGHCGKERWVSLMNKKPISKLCKSCAVAQRFHGAMEASYAWKGGETRNHGGYIEIKLHPDDIFYPMAKHNGYVLKHRLVMAKHLGRYLEKWEIIHHKNGVKDDNRLENLQLLPHQSEHIAIQLMAQYISELEARNELLEKELDNYRSS